MLLDESMVVRDHNQSRNWAGKLRKQTVMVSWSNKSLRFRVRSARLYLSAGGKHDITFCMKMIRIYSVWLDHTNTSCTCWSKETSHVRLQHTWIFLHCLISPLMQYFLGFLSRLSDWQWLYFLLAIVEYVRVSSVPTASHDSVSVREIRIMWQRHTDSTASNVTGYRVVCSYSLKFAPADIINNCYIGSISANESSVILSKRNPSTPLYVRVQVVRTINGLEAVDELSSPTSALICPGDFINKCNCLKH